MSNFNHTNTEPPQPATTATSKPSNFPAKSGRTGQKSAPELSSPRRKGLFQPGISGNPKGRPKGSLNKATVFAHALLQESGPAVARRAIEAAKAGNVTALKLVLERLIPVASDRRLQLDQLTQPSPHRDASDKQTPQDILQAHNQLVESVANGELSPIEAQAISQLLEARRRSWEALVLSRRLNELDELTAESNHKS